MPLTRTPLIDAMALRRRGLMMTLALLMLCPGVDAADQATGLAYHVGPQDVLDIFVWREPDLTKPVVVRPDGGISFPLAGDLMVAGKTPAEIQAELTKRIQAYVPEAVVTVSVSQIASYRIYVLGKVNNPGEYVLGTRVDVAKALAIAKGLNPYAEQDKIRIVRREQDGERVFDFNYADVLQGKNLQQNILLKGGDLIIVP